jgi:hypothetical protein
MSRDEVKSLNDLAMAHGGQLTINPQTGLPEAGFLSAILPMVAGAALGPAGFGIAESALGAGLMVGAGSYLANPKAGLMGALSAGLGGYGGYGLGAGLEKLGTSEGLAQNATALGNEATAKADADVAKQIAEQNAKVAAYQQAQQGAVDQFGKGLTFPGESTAQGSGWASNFKPNAQPLVEDPVGMQTGTRWEHGRVPAFDTTRVSMAPQPYTEAQIADMRQTAADQFTMKDASAGLQAPKGFEAAKIGAQSLFTDPSLEKLKTIGGGSYTGLAQMGLAAAAPAVNLKSNGLAPLPATSGKQVVPHYRYTPGMATPTPAASATGVENTYFPGSRYEVLSDADAQQLYPGYPDYAKPATAANGGIMGYAGGGPVERMSNDATTGQNTMYPMANMTTSAFATPYQDPRSTNMIQNLAPSGGGAVNMMSGEPNMQGTRLAGGGISGSGNLNLSVPLDFGGAGGGGFGGGGANGYSAVGSGFAGQNNSGLNGLGVPQTQSDAKAAATANSAFQNNMAGRPDDFNTGQTPFDNTIEGDTFQPQGTRAFGGNPQQMIGLLSSLLQGQPAGNAYAKSAQMASGGMAMGGLSDAHYNLGGYSDGGRLLRGPGDGVSDSIPAVIGKKQPARLADGEFVVPARIVSELGNGSTEAGARKLYAMMDRIQASRKNTVGKGKVAKNNRADKYLPA